MKPPPSLLSEVLPFAASRERRDEREATARKACLRLRARRRLLGRTQGAVARELGVTQSVLSRYERGEAWPSLPVWLAWCDLLGVSTLPPAVFSLDD